MPDEESYPTSQQRRILWTALTALAVIALLGVGALAFLGFISFLSWSYPILLPIGLAVIVALFLEPVVDFFQHRGLNRERATLTVCILTVIAFLIFWAFFLPTIWSQSYGFFRDLPDNLNKAVAKMQTSLTDPSASAITPIPTPVPATTNSPATNAPVARAQTTAPSTNAAPMSAEAAVHPDSHPSAATAAFHAWLTGNLPAIQESIQKNVASLIYSALGPVGQAFGFILGFGFVPIYVYYFLADQKEIARHWHEYVPLRKSKLRDEVISVLAEINTSLVGYFRGQIIVAACNGVLTFIGLWILGIYFPLLAKYCLVLGLLTGALSIVPFLGIIASIIPALVLAFLSANGDSTGQWLGPLLVVGVFTLVQMSESVFITPRVQSHSTGLHPLTIILGILFWSLLLPGLLGPIVAVPLTCALVVLLRRYVWKHAEKEEPAEPPAETPAA